MTMFSGDSHLRFQTIGTKKKKQLRNNVKTLKDIYEMFGFNCYYGFKEEFSNIFLIGCDNLGYPMISSMKPA